jgi:flagellar motor switch protein FliN/FliY
MTEPAAHEQYDPLRQPDGVARGGSVTPAEPMPETPPEYAEPVVDPAVDPAPTAADPIIEQGVPAGPDAASFEPATLRASGPAGNSPAIGSLSLLHDVDMEVTVELGRTTMPIRELLALQPGMVVEIERDAGAPIDVLVNGRLIACGEVVVIDEEFGIRITEIVSPGNTS